MVPLLLLLAAAPAVVPANDAFLEAAHQIEQGLQAGNADALNSRLDMRALVERSIKDLDAPAEFKKGFLQGANKKPLGANLAAAISEGARIKFLRLVGDPQGPRAVYRFIPRTEASPITSSTWAGRVTGWR